MKPNTTYNTRHQKTDLVWYNHSNGMENKIDTAIHQYHQHVKLKNQQHAVEHILLNTTSPWRSIASLAKESNLTYQQVQKVLATSNFVRNPIDGKQEHQHLYRHKSKGLTRREKQYYLIKILTRQGR